MSIIGEPGEKHFYSGKNRARTKVERDFHPCLLRLVSQVSASRWTGDSMTVICKDRML